MSPHRSPGRTTRAPSGSCPGTRRSSLHGSRSSRTGSTTAMRSGTGRPARRRPVRQGRPRVGHARAGVRSRPARRRALGRLGRRLRRASLPFARSSSPTAAGDSVRRRGGALDVRPDDLRLQPCRAMRGAAGRRVALARRPVGRLRPRPQPLAARGRDRRGARADGGWRAGLRLRGDAGVAAGLGRAGRAGQTGRDLVAGRPPVPQLPDRPAPGQYFHLVQSVPKDGTHPAAAAHLRLSAPRRRGRAAGRSLVLRRRAAKPAVKAALRPLPMLYYGSPLNPSWSGGAGTAAGSTC